MTAVAAMLLAASLVTAPGCGPIEYINQVSIRAANSVAAAKQAGADRYAPYEYTAAEAYLHKAREEAGYAQYQDSIEYGRKAEELAERAKAIALTRMSPPTSSRPAPPAPEGKPEDKPEDKPDDRTDDKPAAAPPAGDGSEAAPDAPAEKPRRKRPETE